jgi:hypothetical protein
VYGIVANPRILFLITRIEVEAQSALLEDHEMVRSERGTPTIRPKNGQCIQGLLVLNAGRPYTHRLDGYYGPDYSREKFGVRSRGSLVDAEAYVLAARPSLCEGTIEMGVKPGDEDP